MMKTTLSRLAVALGGIALGGATILGSLQAHAASTAAPTPDNRTIAASKWLGRASLPALTWTAQTDASGTRFFRSFLSGVGTVDLDATTLEVRQVIYDGELHGLAGHHVEEASALTTAQSFAASHYGGFSSLVQRSAAYVDHGMYREYRVTWQARQGEAWLPISVMIGVNADTGSIVYYWSRRASVIVSTVPVVTQSEAEASALKLVQGAASTPSLEVVPAHGGERLVWITEIHGDPSAGHLHTASFNVIWTDATTGVSSVVAHG